MPGEKAEAGASPGQASRVAPEVDFFNLLDEPRRPWLDTESLKSKFMALSARVHPDRSHGAPEEEREAAHQRYTDLNAAWQCLREPKERLRHLLELELGRRPQDIQRVPGGLTEKFFEIGRLCREAGALAEEKSRLKSPLLKAQLLARSSDISDRLVVKQSEVESERAALNGELQSLNAAWESDDPVRRQTALARVEEIYRLLGYFGRWSEQLHESLVQLTW